MDSQRERLRCMVIAGITLTVVFFLLLALSCVLFFAGLPVINGVIDHMIVIDSNTSSAYKAWQFPGADDLPPEYRAFYVFNLTNHQDVLNGAVPAFEKIGPFTYHEVLTKVDLSFLDNGTATKYSVHYTFYYQPDMSNGSLSDMVWQLNPEYLVVQSNPVLSTLSPFEMKLLGVTTPPIFVNLTIQEYLWGGWQLTISNRHLNHTIPIKVPGVQANNSIEMPNSSYYTGKDNLTNIAQIYKWDGLHILCSPENKSKCDGRSFWAEDTEVSGAGDATQFTPRPDKSFEPTVFVSQFMRAVNIVYNETVSLYGVDLYRYKLSDAMLEPNPIFYQSLIGFSNMTPLLYYNFPNTPEFSILANTSITLPVYMTKPNMLDAQDDYAAKIIGMYPNRTEDDTFIDIEYHTGATFRGNKQVQVNLLFNHTPRSHPNMRTNLFYPSFYVSEYSQITESLANKFRHLVPDTITGFSWAFYIGAPITEALLFLSIALLVYSCIMRRQYASYESIQ